MVANRLFGVTGIARHHHRPNRTLRPAPDLDHFGDFNEMILDPLAAVKTRGSRLFDDGLEISVIRVSKHLGKIPARPKFG
jgi:hypothetical protein